jgi:hypothetical protein
MARSKEDYPLVTARNGEDSWLVIASPEGAKQSRKECCRGLIHQTRYLTYETATFRSQGRIAMLPSVVRNGK